MLTATLLLTSGLIFQSSGISATAAPQLYIPVELVRSGDLKTLLSNPLVGRFELGGSTYTVALEEKQNRYGLLQVDTNGDGQIAKEPVLKWIEETKDGFTRLVASVRLRLGNGEQGLINLVLIPIPGRPALTASPDFGYNGTLALGGTSVPAIVAGPLDENSTIWLDFNGDGLRQSRPETFKLGQPFGFKSGSYVLGSSGGDVEISRLSKDVPEIPYPPVLRAGTVLPHLKFKDLEGRELSLPGSFKDKVVLIDFWATWCPPCIKEIPNLKAAYAEYKAQGLQVVSVSVDNSDAEGVLRRFIEKNEMPWIHTFDGKAFSGNLVLQLGVEAVPVVLLVDGDTGEILSTDEELKGDRLKAEVAKYISQR
jgi:thiol-disulfide isomerase/thioredoxin